MDMANNQALENNDKLTQLVCDATSALERILRDAPLGDRTAFASMVGASLRLDIDLADWDELRTLETKNEFRNLQEYLMGTANIWKIILGVDRASIRPEKLDQGAEILNVYLTSVLKRAISNIHFAGDSRGVEKTAKEFVAFLDEASVKRRVSAPLFHLTLDQEQYDFGEFGTISRVSSGKLSSGPLAEFLDTAGPRSTLDFTIDTGKFLNAQLFDVSACLYQHVTAIRLATHPFVSYNHFSIFHTIPWEFPLRDSDFHARFWGRRFRGPRQSIPPFVMDEEHAEHLNTVHHKLKKLAWNRITPWRLGMDRLDDAVFKLDCGLPDAILDVMIGMEGLFVEPESRQESAHKVATRVARFLADDKASRNEIFKTIKRLYAIRSTLAHGQHWKATKETEFHVGPGAVLLCRALVKMLEQGISRIPHQDLDLS
jgi:hypothetical protein